MLSSWRCAHFFLAGPRAEGVEPITLQLDTGKASSGVSPEVLGLSYETSLLLPGMRGEHYFQGDRLALITLFKTLGVKSLRIGGNSVDAAGFAVPGEGDIRDLLDFAKAAGVKVIYSVRLQETGTTGTTQAGGDSASNAESAAKIARFIHGYAPEVVDCFSIGNEPHYLKVYAEYTAKWKGFGMRCWRFIRRPGFAGRMMIRAGAG